MFASLNAEITSKKVITGFSSFCILILFSLRNTFYHYFYINIHQQDILCIMADPPIMALSPNSSQLKCDNVLIKF